MFMLLCCVDDDDDVGGELQDIIDEESKLRDGLRRASMHRCCAWGVVKEGCGGDDRAYSETVSKESREKACDGMCT